MLVLGLEEFIYAIFSMMVFFAKIYQPDSDSGMGTAPDSFRQVQRSLSAYRPNDYCAAVLAEAEATAEPLALNVDGMAGPFVPWMAWLWDAETWPFQMTHM